MSNLHAVNPLFVLQVLSVLKRTSFEDCYWSFNPKYARPDWMILQDIPIPPPPLRPSEMMDTSSRSEASFFIFPLIVHHKEAKYTYVGHKESE